MLTPDGKTLWSEYAHPGSRSPKQIEAQKNKQKRFCDEWICICQKDNEPEVKAAVGRENYVLRGSEFRRFVEKIRITKIRNLSGTSREKEVLGV
jgi:hypothetical protein